ncbi:MAG: nuclear transport factor 2 family protein [Acidobacteriota bacterium]
MHRLRSVSVFRLILLSALGIGGSAAAFAQSQQSPPESAVAQRAAALDAVERQGKARIELVERYLEAYERLDAEAMGSFYSDSVRFVDPTSEKTPLVTPYVYEGKEDVVRMLSTVSQFYERLELDVVRIWESSGHVVVVANTQGVLRQTDASGRPIELSSQIVTVLLVEGGKIVEHRDYFDYLSAARSAP